MKRIVLAGGVAAFVWLSGQSEVLAQMPSRTSRLVQGIGPSGGVIPSGLPSRRSPKAADSGAARTEPERGAETAETPPWYKRLNPFAKSAPATNESRESADSAPVVRSLQPPADRTSSTPLRAKSSRRAQASLNDDQPGNLFGFDRVRADADQQVERVNQAADQVSRQAEAQVAEQARQVEQQRAKLVERSQPAAENAQSYLEQGEFVPTRTRRTPLFGSLFSSTPFGRSAAETPRQDATPPERNSENTDSAAPTPGTGGPDGAGQDDARQFGAGQYGAGQVDAGLAETERVAVAPVETAPVETAPVETAPDTVRVESSRLETERAESGPVDSRRLGTTAMPPVMDGIDTRRPMRPRGDVVNRVSVEEPADAELTAARRRAERPFDESAEQPVGHSVLPVAGSNSRPSVRTSTMEPSDQPASQAAPSRTWRQKWKTWFSGQE